MVLCPVHMMLLNCSTKFRCCLIEVWDTIVWSLLVAEEGEWRDRGMKMEDWLSVYYFLGSDEVHASHTARAGSKMYVRARNDIVTA